MTNKDSSTSIKIGEIKEISGGQINIAGRDIIQPNSSRQKDTLLDFSKLLSEIKNSLEGLNVDMETMEVILKDIQTVEHQISKEEPKKVIIVSKLKSAFDLITSASGAFVAVEKLSPMLNNAIEVAKRLFN